MFKTEKSKLKLFCYGSPSDRNEARTILLESFLTLLTNLESALYCVRKEHPHEPIDLKIEKAARTVCQWA